MAFDGLKHRIERRRRRKKVLTRELRGVSRRLEHAKQTLKRRREAKREGELWGGSRAVTNEVIAIVGGRARAGSRKRSASDPLSRANPGSDHNEANTSADAVDFLIANAFSLGSDIARRLGGSWDTDYESFTIRRNGHAYTVQIIAGTHGTGPHLHVGVHRA